ncbi:hypothetical protein BGP78_12535 [Pseudoalteromonas sp. MSK9-3]|uniref:winged helix-turn-helix domain-containing protein n=1 Tax=Pseudoalteromonas sp. MSK9-3 TaxID=1897633 RepID=UPI000E6CEEB3|nr:winged helix-turn-helix domain-containing protein [Pseudoalteromonas sp. MSK9-3]RJE76456.1 hypothetical protein BGP78_12535 [Pseudoalteromonas sp. MSK9-3]
MSKSDIFDFTILDVRINVNECCISSEQKSVALQPKFIAVLCLLAREYPNIVSRAQIIEQVWGGNYFVGDKALTNAVWHIRKAFKELGYGIDCIETRRQSGYRLCYAPIIQADLDCAQKTSVKPGYLLFMLALVGFTYFYIFVYQHELNLRLHAPEALTDYPGRELFPNISQDGRYLTYSWRNMAGQTDLYIRDLHDPSGIHKNLTNSEFKESHSAWSADQKTLFYIRKNNGRCDVVSYNLLTSERKQLGQCTANKASNLAVSSNGKWLAFQSINSDKASTSVTLLALSNIPKTNNIVIACDICDEFPAESISFSPDSQWLAISRNDENGHENVYIHDLNTMSYKRITKGHNDLRGFAWYPDGKSILISSVEYGNRVAYQIGLLTGSKDPIAVEGLSYPTFDSQGNLYYHNWQINTSIMKLELATEVASSPFPLLQSAFNFRYADHSDVHEKVVYVTNKSGYDELWSSSIDGVYREKLTNLKLQASNPTWSPDGRHIIFSASSETEHTLYSYNVSTGFTRKLNTGLSYHYKASWSLDSAHFYVSNGDSLYRYNLRSLIEGFDTGGTFVSKGLYAKQLDERKLIVSKGKALGLWEVQLNDDRAPKNLIAGEEIASATGWTVANGGVYYFNVSNSDYRISFYDMYTGTRKDVIRVRERGYSRSQGLAYVKNKQWLLFTGYEMPEIDIIKLPSFT